MSSWMTDDQTLMLAVLRSTTHSEAVTVVTNATDELTSRPLIKPWVKQGFASTAEGLEQHNHPVAAWAYRMLAVKVGEKGELVRLGIEAIQYSREWAAMIKDEIARRIRIWNDIADGKRAAYGIDLFAEVDRLLVADIAREMDDKEEEIRSKPPADIWIADFLCAWFAEAAANVLVDVTKDIDESLVESFPVKDRSPGTLVFAEDISLQLRDSDPRLSWAWQMLSAAKYADILRAVERGDEIVCGSELPFSVKAECIARLEVVKKWAEAKPKISDAYAVDLFALANVSWKSLLPKVEGGIPRRTPEALLMLVGRRWNVEVRDMARATREHLHPDLWGMIGAEMFDLRLKTSKKRINSLIDLLLEDGTFAGGELAIGWMMIVADPKRPSSFHVFLPQLQRLLDTTPFEEALRKMYQDRLNVWWRAAAGDFVAANGTIFDIVESEVKSPGSTVKNGFNAARKEAMREMAEVDMEEIEAQRGPSLVVMPKATSTKLDASHSVHGAFKNLVDERLPLIVARDVGAIRRQLHAEYPHATLAVDLVLRDLRQGKPVTLKPLLLVGGPGAGKSRLVRRLGELLGLYVFRYDGAAAMDGGGFGGVSKFWSSSQPSAPARAVEQARHANPIVMVDEIEKGANDSSGRNGSLHNAMMPFLESETSKRFRDPSLDAELDLSAVTYCATANDDVMLPAPLKDRFRIIRVPDPTLDHLPQLAANVMRELAATDEVRRGDEPLADDELEIIGRAWRRSGMSMRKLQKIVSATLDARDQFSMRH